jgi:hypothetical protein
MGLGQAWRDRHHRRDSLISLGRLPRPVGGGHYPGEPLPSEVAMPDQISNYRFARLSVFPHTTGEQYSWALLSGVVKDGIPYSHIVARGELQLEDGLSGENRIWEVVEELARSGLGRA